MERLTLCMIVRDEEALLARCLAAVAGVVDEVCVLDTGSGDATVEIAREHGARVAPFVWCDDFAAARNASLDLVPEAGGGWILVLDADEALVADGARERLLEFAARHPGEAGHLLVENLADDGPASRAEVTRFFPAGPQWRYRGRIHEQLLHRGASPRRAPTGVVLRHDGYRAERLVARDKLARNEALLAAVLRDDPGDAWAAYHLGRTRAVAGRHAAALQAFETAVAGCPDDAPWVAHLFESAASSLRALGRSRQALDWLGQVEPLFADRADTCFLLALLALDVGELDRARAGFERCLELAGTRPPGGESAPAASTWAPAHNLGVMAEVTGDAATARACYERALTFRPDHRESLEGLERLGVPAAAARTRPQTTAPGAARPG